MRKTKLVLTLQPKIYAIDYIKKYVIRLSGLKQGVHNFEFVIDNKFFDAFEYSEIKKGNINVNIEVEKQERLFILNFIFDGYVTIMCDRCSDFLRHALKGNKQLILKVSDEFFEETDDVVVISDEEHEINISQQLYEFVSLLLPSKRLHQASLDDNKECNQEMIKFLNSQKKTKKKEDPRWNALKAIKENMNKK